MQAFIEQVIDILFPPSEDMRRVRQCEERAFVRKAVPRTHAGTTYLLDFFDPVVRAAIHEAKFHRNPRAIALLAAVLQTHLHGSATSVLVPIPLSRQRLRERGYNQVEEIARAALNGVAGIELVTSALKKVRDTSPQTALSKEARTSNMVDAYTVSDESHVHGRHLILLDDVITTGATMEAARRELVRCGPASVTCLALAH